MWRHLLPNFQHLYENFCDAWNLCPNNQVFSYQCNVKAHGDRTTNNQQPLMFFFLYINSLIREERMWKGTSQKTHLICHHISHHLTLTYSSHYFEIICICTHHSVSKTVDLTDAELGAYKDHSFNVGILEKFK